MTNATTAREPAGPAAQGALRVTVAVPTYRRRDDLAALLPMLCEQVRQVSEGLRGHRCEVLVIDNDPERSAEPVVASWADQGVRYAAEAAPGIAAVRNRAIDEAAGSRLLAFIDDDERPRAEWLARLVQTWEETGAAAVSGRVLTEYAGQLDPWVAAGDFFFRSSRPTGTEIRIAATGNLLLDLDQVRSSGVRFHTGLGLGGGEDTLFSRALARTGRRMVWCDDAVVVDQVPRERMTRRWVLTRAWSHGNATVLTDLRLTAGSLPRLRVRVRGAVNGLARIAGGGLRWLAGVVVRSQRHQARGLRAVCRGAGMVGGALGVVYQEYARGGRRWQLSRVPAR